MGQLQVRRMLCVATLAMLIIESRDGRDRYAQQPLAALEPPSSDTIPQGPSGDSVRLGRLIFTQTPKYARAYVGDQLSYSPSVSLLDQVNCGFSKKPSQT